MRVRSMCVIIHQEIGFANIFSNSLVPPSQYVILGYALTSRSLVCLLPTTDETQAGRNRSRGGGQLSRS